MAGKTLRFFNLTGGLNTVQDLYNINSTTNRTETPDMVNIEYHKLGGLRRMDGNRLIGNNLGYKVTCGYEYIKGNNIYMIVTTLNNKGYIYNYKTKQFDDINLGFNSILTVAPRHSICSFNNGVIITDGSNYAYYEKDRNQLLGKVTGVAGESKLTSTTIDFKAAEEINLVIENSLNKPTVNVLVGDNEYTYHITSTSTNYNEDGTIESSTATIQETITESFTNAECYFTTEVIPFKPIFKNTETKDGEIKDLITPIPLKGLAINSYKGSLWIGSNDNNLYYSSLGMYWDFNISNSAGAFENFNEDKSGFTGLGIWSEYLVLHKKNGTYLLNGTSSDTTQWTVKPYSEMTCDSQQSFISNDIGYYCYDRKNKAIFPLLSRSLYNTTYLAKELSVKINNLFEFIDNTKLDEIYVTYHPQKQYLLFYMNFVDGNGYSNKCYIYDFLTKSWLYRELPQEVTAAFCIDGAVYIGTNDGSVLKEFEGSSFNGEPINFYWLSPSYVWSGGTNKATTKEFRVKLDDTNTNNFNIESIIDGKRTSRKRNINSNLRGNNNNSLIWDIGYNLEDRTYTTTTLIPAFKSVASNGATYYSRGNPATQLGVKLYSQLDSNNSLNEDNYVGINTELFITTESTSNSYNYMTYTTSQVRSWQSFTTEYKCYRNNNNPNILAWVKPTSSTTEALVNLKNGQVSVLQYSAFRLANPTHKDAWLMSTTPSTYEQIVNAINNKQTAHFYNPTYEMFMMSKNGWTRAQLGGGDTGVSTNIKGYAGKPVGLGLWARKSNTVWILWYGTGVYRVPEYDTYTTVTREVWNGRTDSTNAMTKTVSNYSEQSITIEGQSYTRYSNGDYGSLNSPLLYTDMDYPPGSTVYTDKDLTNVYGTVTKVLDDTSFIEVSGIASPSSFRGNVNIQTPNYFIRTAVTFTPEPIMINDYYPYPEELDINTLTNTHWDDDNWVGIGYTTKRLILSNQYFETIQYKFSGDSDGNNIEIAGFEVDGIQLTEVPH